MINDESLKRIIEEVIGNNDPYWNTMVYNIMKKIIDLPNDTTTTIDDLISYNPSEAAVDPRTQGQIINLVKATCKKMNIELEENETGKWFIRVYKTDGTEEEREIVHQKPKCPVCEDFLTYLMPDGGTLYCNKCKKYYKNENGNVGEETTSPYSDKNVLY